MDFAKNLNRVSIVVYLGAMHARGSVTPFSPSSPSPASADPSRVHPSFEPSRGLPAVRMLVLLSPQCPPGCIPRVAVHSQACYVGTWHLRPHDSDEQG